MPEPDLVAFVESRLPLVRHATEMELEGKHSSAWASERRGGAFYSLQQALFYQAEWYVQVQPFVSEEAVKYAAARWGAQADAIWRIRRPQVARLDGCPISQSGLIYEHVYTGSMFRAALLELARSDRLTVEAVARLLEDNYRTAWITREENKRLPKSKRGSCLKDAWDCYERVGIREAPRPSPDASAPPAAMALPEPEAGAAMLAVSHDDDEDETLPVPQAAGARMPGIADDRPLPTIRDEFLALVAESLEHRASERPMTPRQEHYYALLGSGTDPARRLDYHLIVDSGRGRKPWTVELRYCQHTDVPRQEPSSAEWQGLRVWLGRGWNMHFGTRDPSRCYLSRRVLENFDYRVASDDAVAEHVATVVDAILRYWYDPSLPSPDAQ